MINGENMLQKQEQEKFEREFHEKLARAKSVAERDAIGRPYPQNDQNDTPLARMLVGGKKISLLDRVVELEKRCNWLEMRLNELVEYVRG